MYMYSRIFSSRYSLCRSLSLSLTMNNCYALLTTDGFTQQKSYIMKTMLADAQGLGFINTLNIFPREKQMYELIIPQLEELYREQGKSIKFAPKCHWAEDINGRISLVLEDLRSKKLSNINRLKGFNMKQMHCVLEKLAEFHAASAVLQQRNGAYPEDFQRIYLPANYNRSKSYQARVQSYKKAMAQWGFSNPEQYISRIVSEELLIIFCTLKSALFSLQPTADQFVQSAARCFQNDPQEFKVLNHGDLWSGNILLSNSLACDIKDLRFVDFQRCKWGSPAQDLWELIICSSHHSLRIKHFDYFVRIYHTHLVQCLQLLHYAKPLPQLKELHMSMIKYGFWGEFDLMSLISQ